MAGRAPEEIDVILDADGKSVVSAFEYVQREVEKLRRSVNQIGKDSYKNVTDFGKVVNDQAKKLRDAQSSMRALDTAAPGMRDYAKAVAQVKEQKTAQNKAELEGMAQVSAANQRLAKEQVRSAESQKLATAARIDATRVEISENAKALRSIEAVSAARNKNAMDLRRYRDAARVETDPRQQRALQTIIQLETARGVALEKVNRELTKQKNLADNRLAGIDQKTSRAVIPGNVRDMADRDGIKATKIGLQFEQENARYRLLAANTETERLAALRNLDLANQRVAAVNRLAQEENRVLETLKRQANVDVSTQHRAQMALAQSYAKQQIQAEGLQTAMARQREALMLSQNNLRSKAVLGTAQERVEATRLLEIERARLRAMEQEAAQQARQQRGSVGGRVQTAVRNTALYGGVAMLGYGAVNTIQTSIANIVELEDEFAKLQAISNSTDQQMQSLKGSIYQIGEGSRYAINDLVKISQTLAQAGVSAADMKDVLGSVTTLATASGSTPDEAVNLVTSALGAFQLQASEAARIADLMATALNRTKLTVQQVGQAIQYVGGTAFEQNISLENMLATIGAVAQAGVRSGSTIGTGFRQFLVDLQTPSEKLTFQLERLGITQDEVNVKTRGLSAVLETLKQKGFGATQAYGSLEVRAAAFYLVAKNNTDIMDELELSFAQSGAAAIANERAMNSLTSQWQRFKNILQQNLAEGLEGTMNTLKNLLRQINDRMIEMRADSERMRIRQAEGPAAYEREGSSYVGARAKYAFNYDLRPALEGALQGTLNGADRMFAGQWNQSEAELGRKRFGDWLKALESDSKSTGAAVEAYANSIALANDKVNQHGTAISEVDKELNRLKIQQKDLINNTTRSQAETITLSARFGGLVKFLGTTKNAYLDLIQAMGQYRREEANFLADSYEEQSAAQGKQNNLDREKLGSQIGRIKNSSGLMGAMTPLEKKVLNNPNDVNFAQTMRSAAERISKSNSELGTVLYDASIYASRLSNGVRTYNRAERLAGQSRAEGTTLGSSVTGFTGTMQNRLDALSGMDQATRSREGNAMSTSIRSGITELEGKLPGVGGRTPQEKKANADFLRSSITSLKGMLDQITAALKPSQEELKDAKQAAADAKKADRESERKPKVTQADFDKLFEGLGLQMGRGNDDSPAAKARQNAMNRAGQTPATGDTSSHTKTGGVARDARLQGISDERAKELVTILNKRARDAGIDAMFQFETGRGRNQGTGRHIHGQAAAGARMGRDRSAQTEADYDADLDQSQVQLATDDLRNKLKELSAQTGEEAFQTATEAAALALDNLNAALKKTARSELVAKGFDPDGNSPQALARMAQLDQAIAQNFDNFQQTLSDSIIKSVKAQVTAAEKAFQAAIQPAKTAVAVAEARVSGFGYASNANRVPDYVRAASERAAAVAKENLDRSTLSNLPYQISRNETSLAALQDKSNNPLSNTPQLKAEIDALSLSIENLKTQRDSLNESLSAGDFIPTSISGGLAVAIEEYRQANDLTKSFKDTVILNLQGAIEAVHGGLTDMFSSILDGSRTALQAFGDFASGIMRYITQLAAKMLASQILNVLLSLASSAFGPSVAGNGSGNSFQMTTSGVSSVGPGLGSVNGGPAGAPIRRLGGGSVDNGDTMRDSVDTKLARGEWVIRKEAVDSVGNQFMARLNQHGAAALNNQQQAVAPISLPNQEMAVYVVSPEQRPTMSKNDVLIAIQQDVLQGGETKKLIKFVSQGG